MPNRISTSIVSEKGMNLLMAIAGFGILALVYVGLLMRYWPWVGHDFSYFVPRLFDVHLHYSANGPSIQYWTPTFGGGLPAFANPQHTQFMPAQFLTGLLSPFSAIIVASVVLNTLGGLLVARFCARDLGLLGPASLMAGLAFSANGFFLSHLLVGHVAMTTFPLLAILPSLLLNRVSRLLAVGALGLFWSALVYSGSYVICPISGITLLLLAAALPIARPDRFRFSECVLRAAGGVILAVACSLGKLAAMAAWLGQFHAHGLQPSGSPGFELANMLIRLGPWEPWVGLSWGSPGVLHSLAIRLSVDGGTHIWEENQGISLIVWLAILVVIPTLWSRFRRASVARLIPLLVVLWVTIECCIARGPIWSVLSRLPLFSWLHANSRLDSGFILPLVLLGAWSMDVLLRRVHRPVQVAVTAGAIFCIPIAQLGYLAVVRDWPFHAYNLVGIEGAWHRHQADPKATSPVRAVADVSDDEAVCGDVSSLAVYEPVFGYGIPGPQFRTLLVPGPVRSPSGYNVHQPLAFLSPELAGVKAFSAAPADDCRVEEFLARRQPDWPLPRAVLYGNRIAFVALATAVLLIGVGSRSRRCALPAT